MDFSWTTSMVKERVGRFGARIQDRCNEAFAKLLKRGGHSTNDLRKKMQDRNEQLKIICPNFAQLKDSSDNPEENERYYKLEYAVRKGFFDRLLVPPKAYANSYFHLYRYQCSVALAQADAEAILDRNYEPGQQFHAFLFHDSNAGDQQWTLEEKNHHQNNNGKPQTLKIQEYEDYYMRRWGVGDVRQDHPKDIYEVFHDKVTFPNLQPHYRVLDEQGSCFVQAAILQHYYLQLVHNPQMMKNDAYMVSDLSRFLQNCYHGNSLYDYIIRNQGGTFHQVLSELIDGDYKIPEEFGDLTFDAYVAKLKRHGPAIVKMFIGEDFQQRDNNKQQYRYEGTPPPYADSEKEGHVMLLVGVMRVGKDDDDDHDAADFVAAAGNNDLYLILQNFWHDKQFVLVRRDYFRACSIGSQEGRGGGRASVNFVEYNGDFVSANPEAIYAQKAEQDVSLSSHLLERPCSAKRMMRIPSVDSSTGKSHTRWE